MTYLPADGELEFFFRKRDGSNQSAEQVLVVRGSQPLSHRRIFLRLHGNAFDLFFKLKEQPTKSPPARGLDQLIPSGTGEGGARAGGSLTGGASSDVKGGKERKGKKRGGCEEPAGSLFACSPKMIG